MMRYLPFLSAFVSAIFASIPPQTVLTDALGSTRGLVDSSESLTDSYDYKLYGELASHIGSSQNSFLFTGEQFDAGTNNYYLRARYYSPSLTRFLSRDTYDGKASDPLSQNHYLYAGGNPIIYVDPSGHFFGGVMSLGMRVMSTVASGYPRIAGTVQRGTALAIDAYFVKLGLELRNEAMASIIFLLYNGGTKEAMDAAYKKYYYATQIIAGMSDVANDTQKMISYVQAASSFANALPVDRFPFIWEYRVLSAKIKKGMAKIQSNVINRSEIDDLINLVAQAGLLIDKLRRDFW